MEIFGYLGLTVGVLGVIVTYWGIFRFIKAPRYMVLQGTNALISPESSEEIQLLFKGEMVPRVSSVELWFWNAGRKPIKGDDVPPTQPLLVEIQDKQNPHVAILDVAVRKTSRAAIGFRARKLTSCQVEFGFDFLDFNDGSLIEIRHTGSRSTRVIVSGIILGVPLGPRETSWEQPRLLGKVRAMLGLYPDVHKSSIGKRLGFAIPISSGQKTRRY